MPLLWCGRQGPSLSSLRTAVGFPSTIWVEAVWEFAENKVLGILELLLCDGPAFPLTPPAHRDIAWADSYCTQGLITTIDRLMDPPPGAGLPRVVAVPGQSSG